MLDIQKRLTTPFYMLASLPFTAMGLGLHIQISALGAYLSTEMGFKIEEIGFVMAAGPLAGILAQPLVGLLSDKTWFLGGRRRVYIMIAGILAALMFLGFPNLLAIGETLGVTQMVLLAAGMAVFLDLAINVGMNPARSIMADVTPKGDARTKGFTWMQTISGGMAFLASIYGIYYGAVNTFYLAFIFILLFSLLPVLFIKEPRSLTATEEESKTHIAKTNLSQVIKIYLAQAFTWLGLTVVFFFVFAYVSVEIFGVTDIEQLPAALKKSTGESIQQVVFIFFMIQQATGFFYPKFVLDPLARRFGKVKTHAFSVGIMALAFLLIAFLGKSPLALYILMGVGGLGWASVISLPFAILSEDVSKDKMGLYMGIFNLSIVIPQLFVTLLLGAVVADAIDKNVIFYIGGISLAVSAVLWLLVKEHSAKETAAQP